MKNELSLLAWVLYVILLLQLISEPTIALRVYHNNEYEVSDIDRRIEIPLPPDIAPHHRRNHTGLKRHQITLIEQTRKRPHGPSFKRHPPTLRFHVPVLNNTFVSHEASFHRRRPHKASRRQEIIHALNEDTDKTIADDDIEALGRRIDESGNEIKDAKSDSASLLSTVTPTTDKHTAAATRYIISKIKEIQEKLFKRTGSKDLEDKLKLMAPSPAPTPVVKDEKNKTSAEPVNATAITEKKNATEPAPVATPDAKSETKEAPSKSESKDATSKSETKDATSKSETKDATSKSETKDATSKSETKEANKTSDDATIKIAADGSKVPDRRKIIPEEVVDKILEKFQQLKSEAKHIVSESRHSVEHADLEGKVVKGDESAASYEDANDSFNLPISSIQSFTSTESGDVQIPLKVFRGKIEKGNHSKVIGVPIIYVKNKYYLVPAFGAINSTDVQQPETRSFKNIPGLTSYDKNMAAVATRKSSIDSLTPNAYQHANFQTATVVGRHEESATPIGQHEDSEIVEYDTPCIETVNSKELNQASVDICGTSHIERSDVSKTSSDDIRLDDSDVALSKRDDVSTTKVINGLLKSLRTHIQHTSNVTDSARVRGRRQNRYENPQILPSYSNDRPALVEGSSTLGLVNKLLGVPDLPSVEEELRLARSKAEMNSMTQIETNHPSVADPKNVPGDRRTFFDLNNLDESAGYQERDQLSERDGVTGQRVTSYPTNNDNSYETMGESKNLESSLNNFLESNDRRSEDTIPGSEAERRSFQNNNDETNYRPMNEERYTSREATTDTRSYMARPDNYNTPDTSSSDLPNNPMPSFSPDGPLPENVRNVHDIGADDMNQPVSKGYQTTSPEQIHFGLQQNLAASGSPGELSMLDDRYTPNNENNHDIERERGDSRMQGYPSSGQPSTVEDMINQIAQSGLPSGMRNVDVQRVDHSREPMTDVRNTMTSRENRYPDLSGISRELNHDDPLVEDGDPKLTDRIRRLQAETQQMQREYQMLTRGNRNKYANAIGRNTPKSEDRRYENLSPDELLAVHENNNNQLPLYNPTFSQDDGDNGGAEDVTDLQREKQLFEINKFAGKEDLSVIPKMDGSRDTLLDKTPDELLEYARQNSIHNSLKYNTEPYGASASDLNYRRNNAFRNFPDTNDLGGIQSPTMNLNRDSDSPSPFRNGYRRSGYTNGFRSDNNGDVSYHHPAEYLADILRRVNEERRRNNRADISINRLQQYERAKAEELFARLLGSSSYDNGGLQRRDSLPSFNNFYTEYLARARDIIYGRRLPPGSLAAVSVGDHSSMKLVPSNVDHYGSGLFSENPMNNLIQRYYRNPYHRANIPRPNENATSDVTIMSHNATTNRSSSSNETSPENNPTVAEKLVATPTSLLNTSRDNHGNNVTSRNVSTYHFEEVEKQFDEVVNQVKNVYENNNRTNNESKAINLSSLTNTTWSEKPRVLKLLLFLNDKDNRIVNATQLRRKSNILSYHSQNRRRWLINHRRQIRPRFLKLKKRGGSRMRIMNTTVGNFLHSTNKNNIKKPEGVL